jgi:hypothetical protein
MFSMKSPGQGAALAEITGECLELTDGRQVSEEEEKHRLPSEGASEGVQRP